MRRAIAVSLVSVLLPFVVGSLGCGSSMPSPALQPVTAWSQSAVTQLAGQLASQSETLLTMALKEPAFVGERAAYGDMLDKIRDIQENAAGLHQMLRDGKSQAETVTRFEDLQELSRDLQMSENWAYLPEEFTAQAKPVFAALDSLDAYYGTP